MAAETVAEIMMKEEEAENRTADVTIPDLSQDSMQDHSETTGKPVAVKKKRIRARGIHIIMNALLAFYRNLECYGLTNHECNDKLNSNANASHELSFQVKKGA